GAAALKNKYLLWAVTMGEEHDQFEGGEYPGFPVLAQPLQATANYCGMHWLRPVAIHGTYQADHAALIKQIRRYGERLATWREV
ncbi:Glutathione-regulated potassium-efflux system ancillary protein KefF, partial [Pseudomonas syringae pv. maculicola]